MQNHIKNLGRLFVRTQYLVPLAAAAAWIVACVVPTLGQSARGTAGELMARKLASSQKALEGLATEDYELMQRESQRLHLLSQESDWNVLQTRDYIRLSTEFRIAADQLRQAATDKNLDAAGLAYIKLTITCIDCHRHVRSVRKD
jgi:hypothetical protein